MKIDAPFIIALCGLVAALVSAALVWVGAGIDVHNSMEDFIADLQYQARWLLWGARFAVFASVLTLIAHLWPLLRKWNAEH